MIKNRLTAMTFVLGLGLSMHQVDAATSEGTTVVLSDFVSGETCPLKNFIDQLVIEKNALELQGDKGISIHELALREKYIIYLGELITKALEHFECLNSHYRFYFKQEMEAAAQQGEVLRQQGEVLKQENEALRKKHEALRKENEAFDQEEKRLQSQFEKLMKLKQHKCDLK